MSRHVTRAVILALAITSCAEARPEATLRISIGSPSATPIPVASPTPVPTGAAASPVIAMKEFPVPAGSGPHDIAPAKDGGVWYTAQRGGKLGWLDPKTGQTREIALGPGSAPHGVIVDNVGVAWVTDGGQNAIVSVDPRANDTVTVYKIAASR